MQVHFVEFTNRKSSSLHTERTMTWIFTNFGESEGEEKRGLENFSLSRATQNLEQAAASFNDQEKPLIEDCWKAKARTGLVLCLHMHEYEVIKGSLASCIP